MSVSTCLVAFGGYFFDLTATALMSHSDKGHIVIPVPLFCAIPAVIDLWLLSDFHFRAEELIYLL